MKKSQIFLGASAFLLAISGALATKASLKNVTHLVGWTSSSGAVCHKINNQLLTTIKHGLARTARTVGGIKTLYTAQVVGSQTVCGKKLYTNPQN